MVNRATAAANLTGFSVFDQNYAAVNTPQSPVPCVGSGGLVNFYRLGSGARVALAIDPTLITLEGTPLRLRVQWDFTNQKIIAFATTVTGKGWRIRVNQLYGQHSSAGTGFTTWNYNGAAAVCLL